MEKKLFLLDAYALIFRAYHAMKYSAGLRNSDGQMDTSAIFGFVNTLLDVLHKENPTHIAVCFDPAGKTFRHEMYPEYKAGREATPEDIKVAVPYIKEIIRALRIPIMEVEGFEADDVIGTLAVMSRDRGFETYIMSPDKDLSQLVDETVKVYRPGVRGQAAEIRGIKEVCEVFGVNEPKQVIDLLALMGDKVDNVVGCPGVGEKTASKLILEYGSVENIIANAPRLKGALKQKIESNVDNILFSKELVTICTEVPLTFDENLMQRKEPDADEIRRLFTELRFKRLLERVLGEKEPEKKKAASPVADSRPSLFDNLVETEPDVAVEMGTVGGRFVLADDDSLPHLLDDAAKCRTIGLSVVASMGDAMYSRLTGIAIATSSEDAFYVAIPEEAMWCGAVVSALKPLLENKGIMKVGNELKRSLVVLRRNGIALSEPYYDTAIAHYLLQPEMNHSLGRISEIYLSETLPEVEVPAGVKPNKFDPAVNLPAVDYYPAACSYACANLRLMPKLDKLLGDNGMLHLLNDIEFPLIQVLADMEMTGVRIDTAALKDSSVALTAKMEAIEKECHELAGMEFNVASPAQVGEVLFDRLKIDPKAKKTGRGQYSTTEEVLEKLSQKHPLVGKVLEYRKLRKLLSTYVDALPALINPSTGRIHTTFNQTVTATGRLSSTNPNLQNIPIRNDEGREIRKAFIPSEGNVFFSADYSQIELRIVAGISGDATMVEAFREGEDIHRATAAKIFHEDLADVTDDQRRKAKTANFGMVYGISAFGLSERLQIPRSEAKEIIENYFATFPGVKKYMDDSIAKTRETGYVTTLFGRRRLLPDINSRNAVVRGYAERNAINAPIQGTAADIIKIAMVRVHRRFEEEKLQSKMIIQVHDELDFDVVPSELAAVSRIVKEEMEGAYRSVVPLVADCGSGANWLEAH